MIFYGMEKPTNGEIGFLVTYAHTVAPIHLCEGNRGVYNWPLFLLRLREEERERERERRGEYFVRFRSTGCNGGEPHCWPVSRPRLLGRRQRRRRRWWRRWWSRRTSCRRTACLKGRAVLLAASTHTIPPRACALRFACHRGERGVNFNTITPSQPRVNKT